MIITPTALPTPAGEHASTGLIGLAPLMRQAFSGADLTPLAAELIDRAGAHPDDANTLMDLSTLLQLMGKRDLAMATQAEALAMQSIYTIPAARSPVAVRVLAIMGPGDLMANSPLEFLVEDSDIHLDLLYVGAKVAPLTELPEHDVLFIALGQSDANLPLLEALEDATQAWARPMLNAPQRIACLSRDGASALLASATGVAMPLSVRITRDALQRIGLLQVGLADCLQGGVFPIIVRPTASHAGDGLSRLDSAGDIDAYLRTMPQEAFYISRFIDYSNADGLFRKYRIMLIDGRPFVSHMAISSHWMIHYLNAGMTESADKRAEEERFMASFDRDFAVRHAAAFEAVANRLGLEYVGLDCAETRDGKLMIFEADSDMIVHAMDPIEMFPYKQPQMRKLFAAFRAMLIKAAGK